MENSSGSDNLSENTESETSKPENEILNTADTTDAIESANQDQDKPLTRITNDDLIAAKNANIDETIAERIAYAINNNKDMTSTVVVPAMGMLLDDINERPLNSFEQSQYLKTYNDLVKAFNYFHLDPNQYLDPEKYPDPKSLGILSDEERAEQNRRNMRLVDLADKLFDYLSDNKTIAEFISDKKISEQDVADALNRIGMGDISVPIDENKVRREMGISELKTQETPKTDQQNINTAENSNEESVQTPTSETSKTPEAEVPAEQVNASEDQTPTEEPTAEKTDTEEPKTREEIINILRTDPEKYQEQWKAAMGFKYPDTDKWNIDKWINYMDFFNWDGKEMCLDLYDTSRKHPGQEYQLETAKRGYEAAVFFAKLLGDDPSNIPVVPPDLDQLIADKYNIDDDKWILQFVKSKGVPKEYAEQMLTDVLADLNNNISFNVDLRIRDLASKITNGPNFKNIVDGLKTSYMKIVEVVQPQSDDTIKYKDAIRAVVPDEIENPSSMQQVDIPGDDEKKLSNNSATTYTIENKEKLISDYSAEYPKFPKEGMEQIITNVLDDLNYDKFSARNEIINMAKSPSFQDLYRPITNTKDFYIATIKAVTPKNIQTEGYLEKLEKLNSYNMSYDHANEGYSYAKTPEEFISKMTKALTNSPASFDMYARILYKSEFNPRMQNRIANSIIYNLFNNGSKDTAEKFSKALNSYGISAATDETISTADTYNDPTMAQFMDYTVKESSDEPKEYNSETKKETIRERYNQPYSTDTKGKYAKEIDNEIKTILRSLKLPLENNKFAKWRKSNTADNSQFEHAINNICSQMPMGQYILDQVQNCIDTDTQLNVGRLDREVVSADLNNLLDEVYREIFDVIMENKPFLSKTLFKTQSKYGAIVVRIWQAIRSGCVKYIAKELNLADAEVDREIKRISKPYPWHLDHISKNDDKLDRVWIETEIQTELIREQKLQMLMEMNQEDIKSES